MKTLLALAICCLASIAQAQEFPALYDVRGVSTDDMLNIRAGPGVGYPVIGTLAPNARDVEIVEASENGRWLRLNTGESSGWASAFYLQRMGPIWSFGLPTSLACFGTEPFWSLERGGGQILFSDAGFAQSSFSEIWSGPATGRSAAQFGALWHQDDSRIGATFRRELCNDGMSDRVFGMSTLVILQNAAGVQMLAGCCALAP
ncbi:peptide-binding protein [Rhodophyticola sp. CCM32]|uniref:SH3 domain-containing protein n=1 Tax=Rhodophyticola sp. CCM32 TaxID=2916397 RepID=UPI00107F6C6E|nr:SH3 domain-containing protein [Rhodophyticola sp. CCM32]QBY02045.1 peptide-binding protein [Rhodophyticola sp. CCM32]